MKDDHPSAEDQRQDAVQIDAYGVKVRVKPGQAEPDPKDWAEVWGSVHQSLRSFVANSFGLLSTTVKAAGNIIRGIGGFPDAINQRITRGRVQAIQQEEKAQKQLTSGPQQKQLTQAEAVANLQEVLEDIRLDGVAVGVGQLPDGTVVSVAVKPELKDAAVDGAIEAAAEAELAPTANEASDAGFPAQSLFRKAAASAMRSVVEDAATMVIPPTKAKLDEPPRD